jgi:hypothetical protein
MHNLALEFARRGQRGRDREAMTVTPNEHEEPIDKEASSSHIALSGD